MISIKKNYAELGLQDYCDHETSFIDKRTGYLIKN